MGEGPAEAGSHNCVDAWGTHLKSMIQREVREVGEPIILPDLPDLPVNLMVDSSELWELD